MKTSWAVTLPQCNQSPTGSRAAEDEPRQWYAPANVVLIRTEELLVYGVHFTEIIATI